MKIGDTWRKLVAPTVAKLKLAALLGQDCTFKPIGSEALAKVMEDMALKLDTSAALFEEMEKERNG